MAQERLGGDYVSTDTGALVRPMSAGASQSKSIASEISIYDGKAQLNS